MEEEFSLRNLIFQYQQILGADVASEIIYYKVGKWYGAKSSLEYQVTQIF